MLQSSDYQVDHDDEQINTQFLREQMIEKQLMLEKQIREMEEWLEKNSVDFYENLLKQQSGRYGEMQILLKENELKRTGLQRKEKEKQLLIGKIQQYDEQIEKLEELVERMMEQRQLFKKQQMKKMVRKQKSVMKEKKQELKSQIKQREENVKKIDYLKDKISRVNKMIETEYSVMRSKQKSLILNKNKNKKTQLSDPKIQNICSQVSSPILFFQDLETEQKQFSQQRVTQFENYLQKYQSSISSGQEKQSDKDADMNYQINQYLSI